jgi:isoaspartyl peptidase/L-asparaginase-like protein (Ntn-hydrolase superfamily)
MRSDRLRNVHQTNHDTIAMIAIDTQGHVRTSFSLS